MAMLYALHSRCCVDFWPRGRIWMGYKVLWDQAANHTFG